MFNFVNSIVSSFHRKPSVSYLQPKTINVYFKNSLEPKYILLNICHYDYCEFEVVTQKEGEENVYLVYANLHGAVSEKLELGIFETRKEAENAILILTNKLFALDKKLVKLTGLIVVLVILVGLLGDFSGATLRKFVSQPVAQNTPGDMSGFQMGDWKELQKTQQEMQRKADEAVKLTNEMKQKGVMPLGQTGKIPEFAPDAVANTPIGSAVTLPSQPVPQAETTGNPEVNNFVNGLSK